MLLLSFANEIISLLFLITQTHTYTHSLMLSNIILLSTPYVRTLFDAHSFTVASLTIWNSLPPAF